MSDLTVEQLRFLGSTEPFRRLAPEDIRRIAGNTLVREYKKGDSVFSEGETASSVWVLQKGRVQIFKYTSGGKPYAVESIAPGELFGTLCRLGGNGRAYPCTAVSAEATSVFQIPDRVFLEYYRKNPGFIHGVCSLCADRLKDVQDLRCMGQESVPVRTASTLLRLSQVHGPTIPFTKREISELIGATLETTFRTLAEFQKKGYVTSPRGKIHIKKPKALKIFVDKP